MTDEDLIRAFFIYDSQKGCFTLDKGPGKRKTHYMQFLAHMLFTKVKGVKN